MDDHFPLSRSVATRKQLAGQGEFVNVVVTRAKLLWGQTDLELKV
jgi:hypothetical protein